MKLCMRTNEETVVESTHGKKAKDAQLRLKRYYEEQILKEETRDDVPLYFEFSSIFRD